MNWDEEIAPGWRRWEQHLAEWHARRLGDGIPQYSSSTRARSNHSYWSDEEVRKYDTRWAKAQDSPTGGAQFRSDPHPDKIRNLSDAMSVKYERRLRLDDDRPAETAVRELAEQELIRSYSGDVRYAEFETVPAPPSAADLGIVE